MGTVRAISLALALACVASRPALAPLRAAPEPDRAASAAARTSSEIALDRNFAARAWLDASFLALDALAAPRARKTPDAQSLLLTAPLETRALAAVPEPTLLLGLALGLAGLALLRAAPHFG